MRHEAGAHRIQRCLKSDGEILHRVDFGGKAHADAVSAADVCPETAGMEVVLLEEKLKNRRRIGATWLAGAKGVLWQADHEHQEPQNAAVGEFCLESPGLEIWCRSRHNTDQTPFVFDARGNLVASWEMRHVAPEDWTAKGVEVIAPIHWTGGERQLCAAKERRAAGDIAIFDAMTGAFVRRFEEQADRLYVADVSGDWREECIVVNGNELRVYHNDAANPAPERPRLWCRRPYRRRKMTWNYYSP